MMITAEQQRHTNCWTVRYICRSSWPFLSSSQTSHKSCRFVVPVTAQILLNFANDFLCLIIRNSAHPSNYIIISKSLLCFPGRTFSSRHHCEKLYGCCCCCCDHFSTRFRTGEEEQRNKDNRKNRYKTTVNKDGRSRGGISSFASYLAEHPITDERVPLALVCCLVRYCVGCSASKSSIK